MRCTGVELEYVDGTNSKYYRLIHTDTGLWVNAWGRRGKDPTGIKQEQMPRAWSAMDHNELMRDKKEMKGYRPVATLTWDSSLSASTSASLQAQAATLINEHLAAWENESAIAVSRAKERLTLGMGGPQVLLVEGLTHAAVSNPAAAGILEIIKSHPHSASASETGAARRRELSDEIVALVPGELMGAVRLLPHVRRAIQAPAQESDLTTTGLATIVATFVREWAANDAASLSKALEMARLCRV